MRRVLYLLLLCMMMPAAARAQYYVNPDGGQYYHADRQCDAISEKYWAGMREMDEDEAIARVGLSPCERCCKGKDEKKYTQVLGGTDADNLYEIIPLSGGGLLATGDTSSSDGWLSDRSRSGRSGWAACFTPDGCRTWNFCSRHSSNDRMMAPVAHADGSITVLLRSDGNDENQIELIRLDQAGEVIMRKTLMKLSQEEAHCALEWPGIFAGGYVISRIEHRGPRKPVYTWFDFDGNVLRTSEGPHEGSLMAVSQRHAIEVHEDAYWLCGLDAAGNETKLRRLLDVKGSDVTYSDLVSLPDGGVAACGSAAGEAGVDGRVTCFGADGQTKKELHVPGYQLEHLLVLEDGYAVTGRNLIGDCFVMRLNAQGEVVKGWQLQGFLPSDGQAMCRAEDGRIAVLTNLEGEKTENGMMNWEAMLTVLDMR